MKTLPPTPGPNPGQTMQRVKVGMVGLAAVVLLIGLASALFSAANRERPIDAAGAPKATAVANMTAANATQPVETKEPLAELGIAPSAAEANSATPAAEPAK